MSTITSRDFNQDVSAAKRAVITAPVIITDLGKPSLLLLTVEDTTAGFATGEALSIGCHPKTTLNWSPNVSICH